MANYILNMFNSIVRLQKSNTFHVDPKHAKYTTDQKGNTFD